MVQSAWSPTLSRRQSVGLCLKNTTRNAAKAVKALWPCPSTATWIT